VSAAAARRTSKPIAPIEPAWFQPGGQAVVIGVDPDISGAVAVLRWTMRPLPLELEACPSPLDDVVAEVHDMPVETWALGKRAKRQACAASLLALFRGSTATALAAGDAVHAAVEHNTPPHMCGKFAWYGIGYSTGVLTGVLEAAGVPHERVSASRWKSDLGLRKQGKVGSLMLARSLFPGVSLARKKDHGRAEALLIAAWAMGLRLPQQQPAEAEAAGAEATAAEE
jgi:hypothetical protein